MRIEYVLIEKQNKELKKVSKDRIILLFKRCFPEANSSEITIKGARKDFYLPCKITCSNAISEKSTDFIYNISISCEHDDKRKAAELLEKAHLAFQDYIDKDKNYHLIIANDELSEYYCNRAYPKYQKFERQLRHLIFKIVTKAYGNLWAKETLPEEMRKNLREEIKLRNGATREDVVIEAALHEMSMGQLIQYLFYAPSEFSLPDYLDEHISPNQLKGKSKDDLVALIERTRKKSLWNLFLADDFSIEEPQAKLKTLRENRNAVAHCKQFYSVDYIRTVEYIDLFLPKIEAAVKKATIQDPPTVRNVIRGFGEYTIALASISQRINEAIGPAIKAVAEMSAPIYKAFQNETFLASLRYYDEMSKSLASNMSSVLKSFELSSKITDGFSDILKQNLSQSMLGLSESLNQYMLPPANGGLDTSEEQSDSDPEEDTTHADA